MDAQVIGLLILVPFAGVFIYAGIHEYRRYKSKGQATYGLAYDEETGTSHLTAIEEGEESYDPATYDPEDYSDPELRRSADEDKD